MPDASPAKWHLGHTTWFFETFALEPWEAGFSAFDPLFRVLFNSYYIAVGDKHPRAERGLLTRPGSAEVFRYRENVDARLIRLLHVCEDPELRQVVVLGMHHEMQHQELLLTDIKHLFFRSPLFPGYAAGRATTSAATALEWRSFGPGVHEIGRSGSGFAFDNEGPSHRVYLEGYALASRKVTNGEYLAFVRDGGYSNPVHWLAEGWDWVRASGRGHPLYWRATADAWQEFTLAGFQELLPDRPVVHVSYFEADAYARWADARLPTEAEWERAASALPVKGNLAESGEFHPRPASGNGLVQMFGDAWEWTSSSYAPYPGFRAAPGAVGEYNGKFMVNQYVLKGGSCATPEGHVRASYRNFFPAGTTWQFSGIRLARSI